MIALRLSPTHQTARKRLDSRASNLSAETSPEWRADSVQCNVSVIVPTFNRAPLLRECLESLLAQTVSPREILVVDDGSGDNTAEVVASFGERVAYLRQENSGKASALNLGLRHSSGAMVWIFDDDDIADPDALRRLQEALDADPAAGFAFADYDNFRTGPDGARLHSPAPAPRFEADDLLYALIERCFIFQCALLVRRECYDAVGPFDTSFTRAQDYEMLLRLARRYDGVHVPAIAFHQRAHEGVRGTAREPIDGATVWDRQKSFNARVFQSLYDSSTLADFLPPARRTSADPQDRLTAFLRRGAAMARVSLWSHALDDFEKAVDLAGRLGISTLAPAERICLNRVFDEYGPAEELRSDNPLLVLIAGLPHSRFRDALLQALLWPAFRYLLGSLRARDAGRAGAYLRLYRQFGTFGTLPLHLGQAARNQIRRAAAAPKIAHAA